MPEQIIGQILSILGMILTILSFQMKTKKQILMLQTVGTCFFLVSFFLLGSLSAVYLNVVFLVRNVVFYFEDKLKWVRGKACLFVLLIAVIVAGAFGMRTAWDVLPMIGALFGTVAAGMKNENTFRLLKLGDSPCWLIYNFSVPSVGGIVCEMFNIVSIIVGIVRYRKNGLFTVTKGEETQND
jgi:hypothetical protein